MDQYAVIGNPIAHSKSPLIHQLFAEQTHQALHYHAILAPLDSFAQTLRDFQQAGGKGCNVTVPFKQQAWQLVDKHSSHAEILGVVNTITFTKEGLMLGDNTDGVGLVRDITQNQNYSLQNKRLLLIGAGGAVQGVVKALLDEKPKQMFIANRTPAKALELVTKFAQYGPLRGGGFEDLAGQQFDLIINGTSAGLSQQALPLPENLLSVDGWCYDMIYGKSYTLFLQWAQQQHATRAIDGLGMLVEQAAEAFFIWRGVRPQTEAIINQLRNDLSS